MPGPHVAPQQRSRRQGPCPTPSKQSPVTSPEHPLLHHAKTSPATLPQYATRPDPLPTQPYEHCQASQQDRPGSQRYLGAPGPWKAADTTLSPWQRRSEIRTRKRWTARAAETWSGAVGASRSQTKNPYPPPPGSAHRQADWTSQPVRLPALLRGQPLASTRQLQKGLRCPVQRRSLPRELTSLSKQTVSDPSALQAKANPHPRTACAPARRGKGVRRNIS
mmetsp:Transcript_45881/g.121276  ORF Transcript_45881/g.121276 Transcript_45881/m.121276 type:complete len:221 (+) Transcript_45881:1883-2545(+)